MQFTEYTEPNNRKEKKHTQNYAEFKANSYACTQRNKQQ